MSNDINAALEKRIVAALAADSASADLETLIIETKAAIVAADKTADEERERALDPVACPDAAAAREAMQVAPSQSRPVGVSAARSPSSRRCARRVVRMQPEVVLIVGDHHRCEASRLLGFSDVRHWSSGCRHHADIERDAADQSRVVARNDLILWDLLARSERFELPTLRFEV